MNIGRPTGTAESADPTLPVTEPLDLASLMTEHLSADPGTPPGG